MKTLDTIARLAAALTLSLALAFAFAAVIATALHATF